jgi:hypothetical protein
MRTLPELKEPEVKNPVMDPRLSARSSTISSYSKSIDSVEKAIDDIENQFDNKESRMSISSGSQWEEEIILRK